MVGALDLAIAQGLPDGRVIRSVDTVIPLRFKAAEREHVVKKGIELTRTLAIRSDAHQVKIAIRDASGSVGTVTIPASRLNDQP